MTRRTTAPIHTAIATIALCTSATTTLGAGVPDYDFDWATISDPGNNPYSGAIEGIWPNRGSVDYTYRMSKLEVTSAQWLEFMLVAGPALGDIKSIEPVKFGYIAIFPGVYIPLVENADRVPVQGISWRTAAMYVNWLHNDKAASVEALSDGAYDISTFGTNPDGTFTDQPTHHPDAKFWIPTLDEWLKAAHYDPDKNGPGQSGWWDYATTSDTAPVPGPPGIGETSGDRFDWQTENGPLPAWYIPLGAYPDVTSPWGLLDTSGGASEWLEDVYEGIRLGDGSQSGVNFDGQGGVEHINELNGNPPEINFSHGLRIISVIPLPGAWSVMATGVASCLVRKRKR